MKNKKQPLLEESSIYEQLEQIYKNAPVFAGDLIHKQAKDELIKRKWVMFYEDENVSGYVCTEIGKNIYGAWLVVNKSVVNKWTNPDHSKNK